VDFFRTNRRHFLRGAGGFVLPLPMLLSVSERAAEAQARAPKRFFYMNTEHGCIRPENMFPAVSTLSNQLTPYAGHVIRSGALKGTVAGNNTALSPVLTASSSALTANLVGKMSILAGLDAMVSLGHHHAAYLGNLLGLDAEKDPVNSRPTIDQILAWSPGFNGATQVRKRSMQMGAYLEISKGYQNPQAKSGNIVYTPGDGGPLDLFKKLFDGAPTTPPASGPTRTPVVDRVVEHWKGVRSGRFGDAGRLSTEDKQRIDAHLERLLELERSLTVVPTIPAISCSSVTAPTGSSDVGGGAYQQLDTAVSVYKAYNQVVAAAFACDASRVGVCRQEAKWYDTALDWHGSVAHMARSPDRQNILVTASRNQFGVFLDLAQRLEAIKDVDGKSVLDNSLLSWGQEAGFGIHDFFCTPIITMGSAGGALKTGLFADYRNTSAVENKRATEQSTVSGDNAAPPTVAPNPGLPYNRWLATVLLAMGSPASEWERPGEKGYGHPRNDFPTHYTSAKVADNSTILPFLG
jgi:Protein of unknown function (DUF1552)